jgi:nucleoside-diphosphate-sugar epimerase
MTRRLFIFGLGFSGLEIATLARTQGWHVAGTCRTADKAAELQDLGIETHLFDGTTALPDEVIGSASHILCTVAPGTAGDPALKTCAAALRRARWLGYLSTTGVYGDRGGGWVDEDTPPNPGQKRSIERLAAERAWQAFGQEGNATIMIFRLPGIYGPGRSAIDQVLAGTARRLDRPSQLFSRIHVEDIAATVLKAMSQAASSRIYNVADDLPAATADVVAFACDLLGRPVLPLVPWAEAEAAMSPMARSFYAESRRVRNDRIKAELGVVLRYPTYREGLRAIVSS